MKPVKRRKKEMKLSWTPLLTTLILMNGVALTVNAQTSSTSDNPFTQGTKRVILTKAEKEDLLVYADNSKARLERAKEEAKGKSFEEANAIYKDAIVEVVKKSYAEKSRSELLMRYALNEALELTTGIPSADGSSIVTPGLLKSISNQDLLTVILEDSIELALTYYTDDRKAITSGSLTKLPYMDFAARHLGKARVWQTSITEQKYAYEFQVKSLEHFMSAAANTEQTSKANFAEELLKVDQTLNEMQSPPASEQELMSRVRKLRYITRKTDEDVSRKLSVLNAGTPNQGTPVISGGPGPIGMSFSLIRAANVTFQMGSSGSEANRSSDETQHAVSFSHDFEMQTTDVTQDQWTKIMGSNPSSFKTQVSCPNSFRADNGGICPNNPVEQVSWNDAQAFIQKLNAQAGQGCSYRLPTEAEWEYAARGGSTTAYYFGNDVNKLGDNAWFSGNAGNHTHEVAQKGANSFGLYDMAGNVWQWVNDWYGDYPASGATDPTGPGSASSRGIRGGGWNSVARLLRSANRYGGPPDARNGPLGFRLVRACR